MTWKTRMTPERQALGVLEVVAEHSKHARSIEEATADLELLMASIRALSADALIPDLPKHWRRPRGSQRGRNLKDHGIAQAAYDELLDRQQGGCAGCGTTSKLQIDHDHQTGMIRGLLCRDCNVALGILKDSPLRLTRLALYLERPMLGPKSKRVMRIKG